MEKKKKQTKMSSKKVAKTSAEYKLRRKALVCCVSIFASICLMAGGVWAAKEWLDVEVENPIFYVNDTINDDGDIIRIVEGVIQVGSYEELNAISKKVNNGEFVGESQALYSTSVYSIDKNIDCAGKTLTPIGTEANKFSGVFNGNSYSISNFKIEVNSDDVGLFGVTSNAGVYNLNIIGETEVSGNKNVGMIVGRISEQTFVFGCSTNGTVRAKTNVGGVVGSFCSGSIIEACTNNASVLSSADYALVGGIVAGGGGAVASCLNNGNISFDGDAVEVGGIISNNEYLTLKCRNEGKVSGTGKYGILGGVSAKSSGEVRYSFNHGEILNMNVSTIGGVVGVNRGTVKGSYNTAQLSSCDVLGGVVGDNYGVVSSCFNSARLVEYGNFAGGLVGRNLTGSSKIENSYNSGIVSYSDEINSLVERGKYIGGISGWNEGSIGGVYNRAVVSGLEHVDAVCGYSSVDSFSGIVVLDTISVISTGVDLGAFTQYDAELKDEDLMTGDSIISDLEGYSSEIWHEKENDASGKYFLQLNCFLNPENFDERNINIVLNDSLNSVKK